MKARAARLDKQNVEQLCKVCSEREAWICKEEICPVTNVSILRGSDSFPK